MGYLSSEERGYIEVTLREGISVSKITLNLGRHRSSVYREILIKPAVLKILLKCEKSKQEQKQINL